MHSDDLLGSQKTKMYPVTQKVICYMQMCFYMNKYCTYDTNSVEWAN